MAQVIRVTETRIFEYVPNLTTDVYYQHGVTSITEALDVDKKDFVAGEVTLDELGDVVSAQHVWEVVDDDG